jgi:hypothetical protein
MKKYLEATDIKIDKLKFGARCKSRFTLKIKKKCLGAIDIKIYIN